MPAGPSPRLAVLRQGLARELAWLAGAWLLILLLARYTPLDHVLTSLFYDSAARVFPLRDHPFWAVVMHSGLKYLSLALWLALVALWLVWRRSPARQAERAAIGFTLLVGPLAAFAVSALRATSAHSCPWELALYGGLADYFRLFDALPPNPGSGQCAPSGHASSGFLWFSAYLAASGVNRATANRVLAATLVLGLLAGLTQIVRGAHFLSHVLLTAWICFAVAWVCDRAWRLLTTRRR